MALIKCPYCKKMISDKSLKCVGCGKSMDEIIKLKGLLKNTNFETCEVCLTENDEELSKEIRQILLKFPDNFLNMKGVYAILNDLLNVKSSVVYVLCTIGDTVLHSLMYKNMHEDRKSILIDMLNRGATDISVANAVLDVWEDVFK